MSSESYLWIHKIVHRTCALLAPRTAAAAAADSCLELLEEDRQKTFLKKTFVEAVTPSCLYVGATIEV
jgi:hypothetical protein